MLIEVAVARPQPKKRLLKTRESSHRKLASYHGWQVQRHEKAELKHTTKADELSQRITELESLLSEPKKEKTKTKNNKPVKQPVGFAS